eukprot:GHRR01003723.1.p1 GENE.GHRR01003723.1~~GHRR01003723.1.p1  ORF type:complete len:296 (+),score=96.30 GHRR01003723.1:372-1259(+)
MQHAVWHLHCGWSSRMLCDALLQKQPQLQLFLNDWAYVRYLRARSWDLHKAHKMLTATLQWRLEAKPEQIQWHQVEREAATGKTFVSPYRDKDGRPVVVMRPRNQNTHNEQEQVQFLIYCLENASRVADEHRVGKMTWLIDFVGYSMRNAPAVRTSLSVLHTLQNHYPERLGGAVCYHAPTLFSMTWKAVSPFIDPITKKKITFVEKGSQEATVMSERFDLHHVEACMGGYYSGDLFKLDEYRRRMQVEDAAVAASLRALSIRSSSASSSESDASDGSSGSSLTQYTNGGSLVAA